MKMKRLRETLKEMRSVLVAYSGGVDSTFLASVASEVLGNKVLAVFAYSPVCTPGELEETQAFADKLGIRCQIIESNEMENKKFVANTPNRCYYCRRDLFKKLRQIATENKLSWVADGSNYDDLNDYRPGRRAAEEYKVRSPLCEVGLTKKEIRSLLKQKGLPIWNKPASPCLASRIPYGIPVSTDVLSKIAEGEKYLKSLGIRELRLRHHGDIARIEVDENGFAMLLENATRGEIVSRLKNLGYIYITVDLAGYRSGSLNEKIQEVAKGKEDYG